MVKSIRSVLAVGAQSVLGLALMMPFISFSSGFPVGPSLFQLSLAAKWRVTAVKVPALSVNDPTVFVKTPSSWILFHHIWGTTPADSLRFRTSAGSAPLPTKLAPMDVCARLELAAPDRRAITSVTLICVNILWRELILIRRGNLGGLWLFWRNIVELLKLKHISRSIARKK